MYLVLNKWVRTEQLLPQTARHCREQECSLWLRLWEASIKLGASIYRSTYLSSVSCPKELSDLSLPHGFQLSILSGLLRKKNCVVRWATNAVLYPSVRKEMLMFLCTKKSRIGSTFIRGCVLKWRYSGTMLNQFTGSGSTPQPVFGAFQDELLRIKVCVRLHHDREKKFPADSYFTISAVFHWSAEEYTYPFPALPLKKGLYLDPSFVISQRKRWGKVDFQERDLPHSSLPMHLFCSTAACSTSICTPQTAHAVGDRWQRDTALRSLSHPLESRVSIYKVLS